MVKFFLGVAIVAFTSFCGYLLSKKYRRRKLFFQQFRLFNERFLSEISYYRRPLREFFSAYVYQGDFERLLKDFSLALVGKKELSKVFHCEETLEFLTKEEVVKVEAYFRMLGKGDSASQKSYFSAMKEELNTLQNQAETAANRYGDLYIKIGFLCGLFILILIV
jgi:stage III sporulation protein AB